MDSPLGVSYGTTRKDSLNHRRWRRSPGPPGQQEPFAVRRGRLQPSVRVQHLISHLSKQEVMRQGQSGSRPAQPPSAGSPNARFSLPRRLSFGARVPPWLALARPGSPVRPPVGSPTRQRVNASTGSRREPMWPRGLPRPRRASGNERPEAARPRPARTRQDRPAKD